MTTIVHCIDTAETGGTELSLVNLIRNLNSNSWRSIVLHPGEPGLARMIAELRLLGVECETLPTTRGVLGLLHTPALARRLARERPAILHVHLNWPLACATPRLAARLWRTCPVVATVQLFGDLSGLPLASAHTMLFKGTVDHVIAVSGEIADRVHARLRFPLEAIHVVPNGIDARPDQNDRAASVLRQTLGVGDRRMVLNVGRLEQQKGQDILLRAAADIPEAIVVLLGDGPQRADLERLATELGMADRVRFTGARADVATFLAACDIFAFPSRYEGLPLALLEAGAAGRAIIAADIPGVREVVVNECSGLLFPSGDVPALFAAMRRILENTAFGGRLGAAAREVVRTSFTGATMARGVETVYAILSNA